MTLKWIPAGEVSSEFEAKDAITGKLLKQYRSSENKSQGST
jgi:hypothetical protein